MLTTSMAMAVPAHPGKVKVKQPDGTMLTIRLVGDEYLHFNTTDDGYSVVQRADGCYVYAQKDADGRLTASTRVAHDLQERSSDELAWLSQTKKYLTPRMDAATAAEQQAEFSRRAKARQRAAAHEPIYDYNNFHGLILLIQYNDREFSRDDYVQLVTDMANQENYHGYDNSQYGRYTGSVRDYFYDNSMGVFAPQFDVVGPITINYSQYYPKGSTNAAQLTLKAIEAADSLVDFSQYDGDGDGEVDMVYFIFAGLGSNITGNDSRLLWPHASSIYRPNSGWNWQVVCDNVALGRYACSTELFGTNERSIIDGIGTICHEFSHVLGVMDFYDTDYEGSGGQSSHPSTWSIMAGGSYENNSRTPVGYTAYERYAMGFATPELISEEGSYTLPDLAETNKCFRLNTPVKNEFFLLENRQTTSKWDRYLPGHGMLVFRVDSTNVNVWPHNQVNVNPKHNYFELLRAGGAQGTDARASDPFPGTRRVTMLNNSTSPANLLTWAGKPNTFGLENITETAGEISFNIIDVNVLKSIELTESVTIGCGLSLQLTEERYPDTAPYTLEWTSSNSDIVTVDANGLLTGVSAGEADVTVVANGNDELKDTCHVFVRNIHIASSIAEFKSIDANAEAALLLKDALVVFTNGDDAYVRDTSGAIVFRAIPFDLAVGDKLNGSVYGQLTEVNGLHQLSAVSELTNSNGFTLTKDNPVEPREVNVADVTKADYGDLLTLKATQLKSESGIWAVGGDNKIRLYNAFKLKNITVPSKFEGKYFDVTGIFHTNTLKGNIIDELALTAALKEVDAPVINAIQQAQSLPSEATPIAVYTPDGRFVTQTSMAALEQLNLAHGIYIVKAATRTWRIVK